MFLPLVSCSLNILFPGIDILVINVVGFLRAFWICDLVLQLIMEHFYQVLTQKFLLLFFFSYRFNCTYVTFFFFECVVIQQFFNSLLCVFSFFSFCALVCEASIDISSRYRFFSQFHLAFARFQQRHSSNTVF